LAAVAGSNPDVPAHTPKPGSAERKEILQALRAEVKRRHHLDVVFVVKHLKVKMGFAWVHALPRSRDGSSRYEDVSALLKKGKGPWTVVEIPCAEEDNPQCIGNPAYFQKLKERFPKMPPDILPK
jgi:hypothetical protein